MKSAKYKGELMFTERFIVIELSSELMSAKAELNVLNEGGRVYKLTIQAPNIILNINTRNINDVLSAMDKYLKGWRK